MTNSLSYQLIDSLTYRLTDPLEHTFSYLHTNIVQGPLGREEIVNDRPELLPLQRSTEDDLQLDLETPSSSSQSSLFKGLLNSRRLSKDLFSHQQRLPLFILPINTIDIDPDPRIDKTDPQT